MRVSVLLLLTAATACAQPAAQPAFEVASVKPGAPNPGDRININLGTARRGTVTLGNTTLSECIRYAYGLASEEQILGPDWIRDRTIRFDIIAKAAPETPFDQLLLMTQHLLAERFELKIRREQRPIAHGELVVYGSGPKRSTSQEEGPSAMKSFLRGHIAYDHVPMRTFAVLLARQLRETIVDRTNLTGYFDIDVQWTPDDLQAPARKVESPGVDSTPAPEYPDLFGALQRAGLKLGKSKAPLDVLVIEHALKVPAGN